jgi:hypothetical protein
MVNGGFRVKFSTDLGSDKARAHRAESIKALRKSHLWRRECPHQLGISLPFPIRRTLGQGSDLVGYW